MSIPSGGGPATVGIVVVNYGSHSLLAVNLEPFDHHPGVRVIVVDNFSSSAERAAVTALAARRGWDLLTPAVNGGYGTGNNQGLARAHAIGCDVVLVLNPDARIDPDGALHLAHLARSHRRSLISPVIVRPDGTTWFAGAEVVAGTGRVQRTTGPFVSGVDSWLSGACLMAHSDLWAELGGFAVDYFLYWEDVDLSRRCVEAGGTLVVVDDVRAVHDAGGTQAPGRGAGKSALYYRYNCRNRLLFAADHLATGDLLRWVAHTPRESVRILRRGGRRQLVTAPWTVLPAVRGTAEGMVLVAGELTRRARRRWSTRGTS